MTPLFLKKRFEVGDTSGLCHSCEGRNPEGGSGPWIPAFAGMTYSDHRSLLLVSGHAAASSNCKQWIFQGGNHGTFS